MTGAGEETVLQWWWLRHAPSASAANVIHGTDDVAADLSDIEAIGRIAAILPSTSSALISAVPRVVQTYAALAALNTSLPSAETEPDFCEQHFGAWTGRTWDDIATIAQDFWNDPIETAPPGGESYAAMCRRVNRSIAARCARHRDGNIVAVAHAGTIRAALALALDLDYAASIRFEIDPLSLTRIDAFVGPGGLSWRVAAVNSQPHDFNAPG